MSRQKVKYTCQACGYESPKWMGKCPGCLAWNSLQEEIEVSSRSSKNMYSHSPLADKPISISEIQSTSESRITTSYSEFNRVLGGGIVPGSLILVGGDPGIGKSTLLLQVSHMLTQQNQKVLYISGEESAHQLKLRGSRLDVDSPDLLIYCETNTEMIEQAIQHTQPRVVVIDSIQTMYHPQIESAQGTVSQIKECAAQFMRIAKKQGIAIFLVGHVTKEGNLAGPRILEHIVDCVLYFEGERHHTYRILRAVKNRFGSTSEIGIFEMREAGLQQVLNASEVFLSERPIGAIGSTVFASIEGTRPLLVEIQALTSPTQFPSPRRMATGLDYHRLSLMIAVLEKRMGFFLQNQDAYVNVAGGVKLDEPAVDLAVAVSLVSSYKDKQTRPYDVFFGEIGLTGEVRGVSRAEQRVNEAMKLGFERIILPAKTIQGLATYKEIELMGVNHLADALKIAFE
jgi:DNA repair protein RadA/Sms